MRRLVWFGVIIAVMAVLAGAASAQAEDTPTQLRIANYFYNRANVFAGETQVVPNLGFAVVSDYLTVEAGAMTFTVASAAEGAESGSTGDFDLIEGHSYLLVAAGNWETDEQPTLMIFDETDAMAGLDPANNRVLFLHLVTGAPAVDGYVNGEKVGEGVGYGQMFAFDAPAGSFDARFTLAGVETLTLYESSFTSVPQAVTVSAAIGTSPAELSLVLHTRSTITIAEYLETMANEQSNLSVVYQMVTAAGMDGDLAAEGPLTLFAPSDWTFEEVPAATMDALMADPQALADTLRSHIVSGYWPPTALYGQETVTTLSGTDLALSFPDDDWWKINGSISVYDDVRLGNGVLYYIGGLLTAH